LTITQALLMFACIITCQVRSVSQCAPAAVQIALPCSDVSVFWEGCVVDSGAHSNGKTTPARHSAKSHRTHIV